MSIAVASGCEPAFQARVADARIAGAQIAAMPIERMAYTHDTFEARVEKELWANGMEGFMVPVLQKFVSGCGGRVVDDRELQECPPCAALSKWVARAGMEVAAYKAGQGGAARRRSVAEWVYTGDVAPVERALGAKVALVVAFKDTRAAGDAVATATTPRTETATALATNEDAAWKKIGVACLVDLVDGRMLWCESREDTLRDLSSLTGARQAIDALVRPMFAGLNPSCPAGVAPLAQ
jgi:hypothetical protein